MKPPHELLDEVEFSLADSGKSDIDDALLAELLERHACLGIRYREDGTRYLTWQPSWPAWLRWAREQQHHKQSR